MRSPRPLLERRANDRDPLLRPSRWRMPNTAPQRTGTLRPPCRPGSPQPPIGSPIRDEWIGEFFQAFRHECLTEEESDIRGMLSPQRHSVR
jgi:hypothetical protein